MTDFRFGKKKLFLLHVLVVIVVVVAVIRINIKLRKHTKMAWGPLGIKRKINHTSKWSQSVIVYCKTCVCVCVMDMYLYIYIQIRNTAIIFIIIIFLGLSMSICGVYWTYNLWCIIIIYFVFNSMRCFLNVQY